MIVNNEIIPKTIRCNKCFKSITWDSQEDQQQILGNRIVICPNCGEHNIIDDEDNDILQIMINSIIDGTEIEY